MCLTAHSLAASHQLGHCAHGFIPGYSPVRNLSAQSGPPSHGFIPGYSPVRNLSAQSGPPPIPRLHVIQEDNLGRRLPTGRPKGNEHRHASEATS
jgi:hypothetical protein